jgi:hypothetical protein
MARPKKFNADYFSHDADMRNDPKLKALRRKFGIEGYAIWNMMMEILTDSNDFEYEWSELNIELLSGDFDVEPEFLKEIINYCFKLKLLQIEDDLIFSSKLKERFETMLNRRKEDRKRKEKGFSAGKIQDIKVIRTESTQSKVKESKGKESKEKKKRESRAINFLKTEYPQRFETDFLMKYKSKIENTKKFAQDFNDTVDQESLEFTDRILFARLGKYSRNWIENQNKYSKTPAPDSYESGKLKRF